MLSTEVIIVGAGPVGATLACELGTRGIRTIVIEERTTASDHPKATLLGARSMEYFRRWGLVPSIYANALPNDAPYVISISTRLAGEELYRVTSPSINDTWKRNLAATEKFRELQWSPYGKTQIGQSQLEPIIWNFAQTLPSVDIKLGHLLQSFQQSHDHVHVTATDVQTGQTVEVQAPFLVACDGGGSFVRRQSGIRYMGRGAMRANVSFYFESEDFLKVHGKGLGNLYFCFATDSFGVFTAINGRDLWKYQYYFLDDKKSTENLDYQEILFRAVGKPFQYKLKATQHWHHHQSVAKNWRVGLNPLDSKNGRIFLAGDAAHLFAPTGGVGMNTGIGDAVDLGWKLAEFLRGRGAEGLLASYEIERKPIAIRNSVISANNSDKIDMVMAETPAIIDQEGEDAKLCRQQLTEKIKWMSRQFSSAGTHLGYRYVDSPVIAYDGTYEPPDDPSQVIPTTWPGSRAPHAWLTNHRNGLDVSTLDWFKQGWTLICATQDHSSSTECHQLKKAFADQKIELVIITLDNDTVRALYERKFVLVRPDGHVAWRGHVMHQSPDLLVKKITGQVL